jgi:hypothetical protein
MTPLRTLSTAALVAAALAAGCDRGTPAASNTGFRQPGGSAVQPAPATAAASTQLPVSPSGSTNASTAAQGSDLSNSTRATGNSNVYQPPSGDNAAPAAASGAATTSTGQATSSQTLGTSVPPNDGTLPGGTTGSTGSRRGGGKS